MTIKKEAVGFLKPENIVSGKPPERPLKFYVLFN